MHPANQRPGKPDKLSQGAHKQASYPRVQWGTTLDKRETTDPRGEGIKEERSNQATNQCRGECKVRNNQGYRTTHAAGR